MAAEMTSWKEFFFKNKRKCLLKVAQTNLMSV